MIDGSHVFLYVQIPNNAGNGGIVVLLHGWYRYDIIIGVKGGFGVC